MLVSASRRSEVDKERYQNKCDDTFGDVHEELAGLVSHVEETTLDHMTLSELRFVRDTLKALNYYTRTIQLVRARG